MLKKDELETIVHPKPSGSVASYAQSIMEDMSSKQLSVIKRNMSFDRSHVSGENVHHRFENNNPFIAYPHLLSRRKNLRMSVLVKNNMKMGGLYSGTI